MQLKNLTRILGSPNPLLERKVEINMAILDRIHVLLNRHFNGRQKNLAEALDISEAAVSKMINGYKNFEIDTLLKLEQAFGEPIIGVHTDENNPDADYTAIATSCTIRAHWQVCDTGDLNKIDFTPTSVHLSPLGSTNTESTIFS
ncbi:MAG: helix-turn-helix transcriptional regulator [Flavobacterium sp.]|nr:helix-turn-helix transcriptional regulator [Flavobacterium sp.]